MHIIDVHVFCKSFNNCFDSATEYRPCCHSPLEVRFWQVHVASLGAGLFTPAKPGSSRHSLLPLCSPGYTTGGSSPWQGGLGAHFHLILWALHCFTRALGPMSHDVPTIRKYLPRPDRLPEWVCLQNHSFWVSRTLKAFCYWESLSLCCLGEKAFHLPLYFETRDGQ